MTDSYVALIGAANIDIQGFSSSALIDRDSNPGRIEFCPGGVSRNIAENLSRLGIRTELISAIGGDPNGTMILDSCKSCGIGTGHSLIVPDAVSSVYLAIMDESRDMALALSDMTISDNITVDFLKSISQILESAEIIVLDTCLATEVIDFILMRFTDKPIYIDPVSVGKAKAIKKSTGKVHTLKMNRLEAEFLSEIEIEGISGMEKASSWFLDHGVKRVFITLGNNGVYFRDSLMSGNFKPPEANIRNATGAGDAFMAGIVYGSLKGFDLEKIVRFALGVSLAALAGEETVNTEMDLEYIEKLTGELFNDLRLP